MNLIRSLNRSELGRGLWTFRKEFLWVGLFSLVANLLMLTPTLYMLQVFDRVMLSQSEVTLIAVTLVMVLFTAVMAIAELFPSADQTADRAQGIRHQRIRGNHRAQGNLATNRQPSTKRQKQ